MPVEILAKTFGFFLQITKPLLIHVVERKDYLLHMKGLENIFIANILRRLDPTAPVDCQTVPRTFVRCISFSIEFRDVDITILVLM